MRGSHQPFGLHYCDSLDLPVFFDTTTIISVHFGFAFTDGLSLVVGLIYSSFAVFLESESAGKLEISCTNSKPKSVVKISKMIGCECRDRLGEKAEQVLKFIIILNSTLL